MCIFSEVDKMNDDVVQQCFSNFKRGDKTSNVCLMIMVLLYMIVFIAYRPYRVYEFQ